MIKLTLVPIFILLLTGSVLFGVVSAQDETSPTDTSPTETVLTINDALYKQALTAYNLSLEKYKKAHEEYLLRRSQYIKFKTLIAQQEASKATLEMLIARNDVVISYLNVLRERLFIAEGVSYETKNRLDIAINLEKDWYMKHTEVLPSAETLENLVSDSNEASARYRQTKVLAYEIFYYISDGKIEDFRIRLNNIMGELKVVKDTIKSEERPEYQLDSRKIKNIERALLESENRMARASELQLKAREEVYRLTKSQDGLSVYNSMLISLTGSQQFFREVSSFLKEVIREIKSSN
ncbi:MAG: hypothetical protein NZM26_02435 [Patescibacteria group bacterium]|nr:hypothetical protein [Patescibacteria group bacterium]